VWKMSKCDNRIGTIVDKEMQIQRPMWLSKDEYDVKSGQVPFGTDCDERLGKAEGLGSEQDWQAAVACSRRHLQQPTPRQTLQLVRVSALESRLSYRPSHTHLYRYRLSRTSTAVAHASHTSHAHPPPIMSARQQQMGRPGGARFAQFKLVLLGMPNLRPMHLTPVC
jgi:hypothetical protein